MRYAIGVDIGATKIRGVVVRGDGRILISREIETKAKRKRAAILADIFNIIGWLKKAANFRRLRLEGVGIGVPGLIRKGKLIFGGGTLAQFKGLNLKERIKKECGLKVFLENDSVCFALAESYFGSGKKYKRIAGIIWGTGIGAGFINKNNRSRTSVEIGHIVAEPKIKSEPRDTCGARGCVENLASGKNIIRRYYTKGGKLKNAGVREIYRSKEKAAQEVLEDAYKYLGLGVSFLIKMAKPDIVIIGGGVSNLPEAAHRKLRNYIYKYAPPAKKKLKITKSKLGNFSGALGAAMLVS
ncbi:MAG: ROK family protein, partial [bacterium]|nr:ROK family protein [bacterium]